jgi:glutaminase
MLRKRIQTRMLVSLLVVATFVSAPLSLPGQNTSPVAPTRAQMEAVVREAYEKFKSDPGGKNADYIPYLAQVDSKLFGIAIVTTDNKLLTMGDIDYSFSIQSISKVFSQALAMEELGPNKVFEKVGSEPTGRAFNSVLAVADMPSHTGNSYVNAGAIARVSLISANTANEKWNKILDFYSRVAGEKLKLIDEVYKSEAATNTGNKALSMLLAKYDRIYADPFESVDVHQAMFCRRKRGPVGPYGSNAGEQRKESGNRRAGNQAAKHSPHSLNDDHGGTVRRVGWLGLARRSPREERGRWWHSCCRSREGCDRSLCSPTG